jgi:hypothetical protein
VVVLLAGCGGSIAVDDASTDGKDSGLADTSTSDISVIAPPDATHADTSSAVEASAPDASSALGACADRCLASNGSSPGDFTLRAASCVCGSCTACNPSELCGGDGVPSDACMHCFAGLFGPTGACTTDQYYPTMCANNGPCAATVACLRACDHP